MDPTQPATRNTLKTLGEMLDERVISKQMKAAVAFELREGINQGKASALITFLGASPRTEAAEAARDVVTEEGMYELDGHQYEVVRAKAGHLYALDAETGEFAKGIFYKLKASDRMEMA
jgi:hypothetical protein